MRVPLLLGFDGTGGAKATRDVILMEVVALRLWRWRGGSYHLV
jgi:hypothetical protein